MACYGDDFTFLLNTIKAIELNETGFAISQLACSGPARMISEI
jgi:hypothetical protein